MIANEMGGHSAWLLTARQYAVAAGAAIASAAAWWAVTRRPFVGAMIMVIALVQPLMARRDQETARSRIVWAFVFGGFVAGLNALARWLGWGF